MRLDSRKEKDVLIIDCLDSRLDAQVAVDFKKTMVRFISDGEKLIVLNIADVSFIDSSGLSAIVSTLKLLGRDGDIVIASAQDAVIRMFKLTRMDRVFKMFPSTAQALTALTTSSQ